MLIQIKDKFLKRINLHSIYNLYDKVYENCASINDLINNNKKNSSTIKDLINENNEKKIQI
jgi:hypothetical protein